MNLTQEQMDAYVASKGIRCPECGSKVIRTDSIEYDEPLSTRNTCEKCGGEWWDIYTLTYIEPIN